MKNDTTPSFVIELELQLNHPQTRFVEKRMHAAVNIYNDCLGEALKRMHKIRHDRRYQDLLKQYAVLKRAGKDAKAVASQMKSIASYYGFTEYDMHAYVCAAKHHYGTLGIDECQKLASRAYKTVAQILYGDAKEVHFVPCGSAFSIEGKSAKSTLKYSGGKTIQFGKGHELAFTLPKNKRDYNYVTTALMSRVKFIRIIGRDIRSRRRYFVQFVLEGYPPDRERSYGEFVPVGLDEGVSTIAVSSDSTLRLYELAPDCQADEKRLRRIQRAMDRSRKATNPQEYNSDGTVREQAHHWNKSNHYQKLQSKRKELYRQIAAKRKQSHEMLANKILALGTDIRVEQMYMKALAKRAKQTSKNKHGHFRSKKRYGKTISQRAPAMLISIIDRKLHYIGLCISPINTWNLKASQYDHVTDTYHKKQLFDRIIQVGGETVQRDLYSAFLIQHTDLSTETITRSECIADYPDFVTKCQSEITRIKQQGSRHMQWYVRNNKKKSGSKTTELQSIAHTA